MTLVLRYEVTPRVTELLRQIDRSRELVERQLQSAEDFEGVLRRQVMATVVHYSTKIEGNRLSREQVEAIIKGESIDAPQKDKIEAQNYFEAMRWASTMADDPAFRLDHQSLYTLHFLVGKDLGEDYSPLGRYREAQNSVSDRNSDVVIYWPPRTEEVHDLMEELLKWLRRAEAAHTSPYIINAIAHLNFVAIHPFADGNGRVARVLSSLLLMRDGHRSQAFYSLEEYFGVHWREYAAQIEKVLGARWRPEDAQCTSWVEWYLEAIAEQVGEAEADLRRSMGEVLVVVLGMMSDGYKFGREFLAVWLAVREGKVTNKDYRTAAGISQRQASDDLRRLTESGYLRSLGAKRGTYYVPGVAVDRWGSIDEFVATYVERGAEALRETMRHLGAAIQGSLFDLEEEVSAHP